MDQRDQQNQKRLHFPNGSPIQQENDSLPLPFLPSIVIAMAEKRRCGVTSGMSEVKTTKSETERDVLSQMGVGELLRGALLKLVESRSDDPIGFLADHFCNLASVTDNGAAGCSDGDQPNSGPQEQQYLNRALWHLRLAHHSQRFVQKWMGCTEGLKLLTMLCLIELPHKIKA